MADVEMTHVAGGSNEPDLRLLLSRAQIALVLDLTQKAESGAITHQEMGVLRNLLKDNGLVAGIGADPVKDAKEADEAPLPEYGAPEYE